MLLPENFNKSESLRTALQKARPIMELAFHAADNAENQEAKLDDANVLTNAQRHAGWVAIQRYKMRVLAMTGLPQDEPSPLLDAHLGIDAFDLIAINAEREAAEQESSKPKPTKKK